MHRHTRAGLHTLYAHCLLADGLRNPVDTTLLCVCVLCVSGRVESPDQPLLPLRCRDPLTHLRPGLICVNRLNRL